MTGQTIPARFESQIRVRFDEAGADGFARTSAYLRYVQDVAWLHSEGAGFGRDWYGERSLTWLVRATALDVFGAVEYGTTLAVSTEVVGFRRVWARRLSEIQRAEDAEPIARVVIDWVLLGPAGMPTRVPREIADAFPVTLPSFAPLRVALGLPPPDAATHEFVVSRRDLDPMAHMNNAAYVDYLEELLDSSGADGLTRATPRRYALEYALPAPPGLPVIGAAWPSDGAWAYRLASRDGSVLFRATVRSDRSEPARDAQSLRPRNAPRSADPTASAAKRAPST